ncbi:helix-turn-helix transcriptional regulator [Frondihabitans australicus]|uniref:helix-turn-helix transcriptional regulator n=1 Tax=Frondihabitans australicus TaxID=386892 RepID=UPI001FE53EAA|nr:LuxR C-terminal-related transcriptional regulator [Frondihabitans australicus]
MNSRNDTTVDPRTSSALQLDHRTLLETIEAMWPQIAPIQGSRLRDAVRSVPEGEWSGRPRILLALAASHRSIGSTSRSAALPWLRAVDKAITADPASPLDVRAGYLIQLATTERSMGDFVSALAHLERARTLIEQDDSLEISRRIDLSASFSLQLGLTRIHLGAFDESQFALALAEGLADEHLSPAETVEVHSGLAYVAYQLGDFAEAEKHSDLALQHAEGTELGRSAFGALAQLTRFLLLVEQDSSTADHDSLLRDLRIASRNSDWEPDALFAEALSRYAVGAAIEALDLLGRVARLSASYTGELVLEAGSRILRAEILRSLGETDAARSTLAGLEPSQHHVTCPARLIALSQFTVGDPQAALDTLEDCLRLGDLHSTRAMAQVYALSAAAHYDLGRTIASGIAFDRALLAGATHDISWPFDTLPGEVLEHLLALATERPQSPATAALIDRLSGGATDETAALADPLSERELVIVRHLATGATLSQIGVELFISVNTVKSHVRSIYRKLSATNRREAIARAIALGLTDSH